MTTVPPSTPRPPAVPWYERTSFLASALLLAAVLPYLNTFGVPWYFDDSNNIYENPLIRDLPRALRGILEGRGLAYVTFALNHRFGGLDPTGYHVVNLVIHALSVLLVWRLLRRLPGLPLLWATVGALLFAVHPLQTQGVTYVVQRMTCLSALFFVAAVCCYLDYLDGAGSRRRVMYGLALCSGALAVLTKENTAVLPLVLLLTERMFRPGRGWRLQLATLAPFCLAPLWKVAEMLLLPLWRGDVEATVRYADQMQSMMNVTPLRYLFTEFPVIFYYFKLLLWPVGQILDYGWPVVDSVLNPTSLAALAGLVALWLCAWRLRRSRPLLSFGIAWFFVTLSVESSVLILDPIFEHRLYLPMVGFALVVIELLRQLPRPAWQAAVLAVVLPLLALLTWRRNALWADRIAFLEDNLRKRPDNVRVMVMLGNVYAESKRIREGQQLLERAVQLSERYDYAYTGLGKILIDQGRSAEAIPSLLKGLQYNPRSVILHEYLGIAYGNTGDFPRALDHLKEAAALKPDDASIYTNIGVICSRLGDDRQAVDQFERALQLAPDSEKTLFNYASTLFTLGENRKAFEALRAVVGINPANADAQYGMGTLAVEYGTRDEVVAARDALRRLGDEERARDLDALLSR